MLFDKDSELDLLLAVLGVILILVWAFTPIVRTMGPPWGMVLAIAAGWPTVANLLRYKRAPLGCAVVPAGLLLFLVARLTELPVEVQGAALLLPNLPFYLWISAIKPYTERRAALAALGEISATQDPSVWAGHLEHSALAVRLAAAESLVGRPFDEVSSLLAPPLQSTDPGARGAAAQTIRGLAEREPERVAEWLEAQSKQSQLNASSSSDPSPEGERGYPAAGLLAELDPLRAEALLDAESSTGLQLAVAEGLLYRSAATEDSDFERAATLLVKVLGASEVHAQRGDAYYLGARLSGESPALTAALLDALRARTDPPSVEELALLGELGQSGQDALRAARFTGQEDYDLASAAAEAVGGILARTESLGSFEAETAAALSRARDEIRERHPQSENRLADKLVERLEALISETSPA